ncbi:hypothetical protein ACVBEH_31885, partial [Roseateles sp. GG27B]
SPGAFSSLLRANAKVGVAPTGGNAMLGSGSRPAAQGSASAASAPVAAETDREALLQLDVTPQVAAGGTVAVTLKNGS